MPIKKVSKEACAKMLINQCDFKYHSHFGKDTYGFSEDTLIRLCSEIIEICRQHTEIDIPQDKNQPLCQ